MRMSKVHRGQDVAKAIVVWAILAMPGIAPDRSQAAEPVKGATKQAGLGHDVKLEVVYIPPGEFLMGSTAEEKQWAVGQDGGALFSSGGGGIREGYEESLGGCE